MHIGVADNEEELHLSASSLAYYVHTNRDPPVVKTTTFLAVVAVLVVLNVAAFYAGRMTAGVTGGDKMTGEKMTGEKMIEDKMIEAIDGERMQLVLELQKANQQIDQLHKQLQSVSPLPHQSLSGESMDGVGNSSSDPSSSNPYFYAQMPLNLLAVNKQGQRVEQVLYPFKSIQKKRQLYHQERLKFIDSQPQGSLSLAKFNLVYSEEEQRQAEAANEKEWVRMQATYNISSVRGEQPICLVSGSYNNNAQFRIEQSLNSIFRQNYSRYRAVIIDDASTDGSAYIYRHYFQFYNIHPNHYLFIQNSRRAYALSNYFQAVRHHCQPHSIVITLDGDDQLVGTNVFTLFNWAYQTKRVGVLYSNFYWYDQPRQVRLGFTQDYTPQEKAAASFRQVPTKFSQLRSFLAELFLQIEEKDLKDEQGNFWSISSDIAMMLPLMELACGRVAKIEGEYSYLYNYNTGLNDFNQKDRQMQVENKIRSMNKYKCYEPFDARMNRPD